MCLVGIWVLVPSASCPRRQNIPRGVPVPDSVPYYSSDEEGGDDDDESRSDDSEGETREMLGSPSPSEEEDAIVSRLPGRGSWFPVVPCFQGCSSS